MSGGVDSSAVAALLNSTQNTCEGITLVLRKFNAGCCNEKDILDAKKVCEKLGIPHSTADFSEGFQEYVIQPFIHEYEIGNTPNPCILCNRYMKFGGLYDIAEKNGFDKVATGHYARVEFDEKTGNYLLKKAKNSDKDQTYFLYFLTQKQLSMTLFPLGDYESKDEIRQYAEANGLLNARKKDSQDICFVDGDYFEFIENHTGKKYPHGNFVDIDGNILGEHKGIIRYTTGQRKGLGLALPEPLYVKEKNMAENRVILSPESEIFSDSLIAENFNFICPLPQEGITAKTRYTKVETPCKCEILDDGKVKIDFERPVRAVTKGQAVVLYYGDICLGGGKIS